MSLPRASDLNLCAPQLDLSQSVSPWVSSYSFVRVRCLVPSRIWLPRDHSEHVRASEFLHGRRKRTGNLAREKSSDSRYITSSEWICLPLGRACDTAQSWCHHNTSCPLVSMIYTDSP